MKFTRLAALVCVRNALYRAATFAHKTGSYYEGVSREIDGLTQGYLYVNPYKTGTLRNYQWNLGAHSYRNATKFYDNFAWQDCQFGD